METGGGGAAAPRLMPEGTSSTMTCSHWLSKQCQPRPFARTGRRQPAAVPPSPSCHCIDCKSSMKGRSGVALTQFSLVVVKIILDPGSWAIQPTACSPTKLTQGPSPAPLHALLHQTCSLGSCSVTPPPPPPSAPLHVAHKYAPHLSRLPHCM